MLKHAGIFYSVAGRRGEGVAVIDASSDLRKVEIPKLRRKIPFIP